MAERVRVPALLSREPTMWLSAGAAVLGAVGVVVWGAVSRPDDAPFVVAVAVLLVAAGLGIAGRRTWLDVTHGTVVRTVLFIPARSVAWSSAERIALADNGAGQLLLGVRGAGRRTSLYLPLAADDLGGRRRQDPAFLRLLADQVETWAPRHARIAGQVRMLADEWPRQ